MASNAQIALEAAVKSTSHFNLNERTIIYKADIFLKWLEGHA